MEPRPEMNWEHSLEQLARRFEYPPTPDVAAVAAAVARRQMPDGRPQPESHVKSGDHPSSVVRRLTWAFVILALLAAAALAIPQTRAAVLSLFARIGAVDIFIDETVPTATPPAEESGAIGPPPTAAPPTATLAGRVDHSMALFDLGRPVTPEEARQSADFASVLPAALDAPDEAYAHNNVDLPAVTFVWREEDGAPLSLTEIGIGAFAMKMVGEDGVRPVQVGDQPAVWIAGPHMLQLLGYTEATSLLIESNVLIWAAGDVTYRLEGKLTLDEARTIAESVNRSGD